MLIERTINVSINESSEKLETLFSAIDGPESTEVYQNAVSGSQTMVNAGTFTVPLSSLVSASGFFVRCEDGDVDVTVNGVTLQLRRASAVAGVSAKMFLDTAVSTLVFTAVGAPRVLFAVWGDPTP